MFTIFGVLGDFIEGFFGQNHNFYTFIILLCSMATVVALWFLGTNVEKNHAETKKKIDDSSESKSSWWY